MRKLIYLVVFTAAIAATSCSKEPGTNVEKPVGKIEAKFDTNISAMQQTRVANDRFEGQDRIGLYMKPAGMGLSAATVSNLQTSVAGDGTLNPSNPIYYPEEGNVDFVAYYPYGYVENNRLLISVYEDQRYGLPYEVLYSDNATDRAASEEKVNLNFGYILPKIVLTVTATQESAFDASHFQNMDVSIEGVRLNDYLDLATGSVVGEPMDLTGILMSKIGNNATSATFEALILPVETATEMFFSFHLNDVTYTYPATDVYLSGKQYNLSFELNVPVPPEEPTVVLAGANITPRSPEGRNYEFNALELPTNLQVTAMEVVPETGRLQNAFTWDAIEDAQIYEFTLYARATGSGQPFEMEYWAQTYTPEMQLSGYSPSYDYRWSVKAIRYYETTREVYGPAFASEAYPLVPPTGMVTTNIFSDAATLGWNPVIGVHGYEVQLNDNPDLVFTAGGFGREVMSYTMTDLAPATTYSWRVRARIGSEYSEWSGAVDFVTSSVGSWDMNTISGMPYSSSADPMNTTWPSAWAGSISHSGYTYQFSNGFATDYYLPVKVRSDRFFLDNTSTLDILRLQDGNTVELRAAAFQLVENGTMLRIVPMTGCSIELIWNDAAKTLTFPTIYDGAELVYSIYAFLYDEGIPDIVGYYTSLSSYYSNVVMTVDTAAGGGTRMSATRVNIAPSRIDGVGSALATPEMPVRGIVTGSVYYTTSLTR